MRFVIVWARGQLYCVLRFVRFVAMSDEAARVVEGAGPGHIVINSSSSTEQDSAYRVGSNNLSHIRTSLRRHVPVYT